jgi:hypothetical protein
VDNIEIGLAEIEWSGVDWVGLAQDRDKWSVLVNAVMNLPDSIECWETIECLHNWWPIE